jgi:hypothetical protein
MKKINRQYIKSITEVNMIINMFSKDIQEKIPIKIREFFRINADEELENEIKIDQDFSKLSLRTKKLLKVIDVYVNPDSYK